MSTYPMDLAPFGLPIADIMHLRDARLRNYGPVFSTMRKVIDTVNGDIPIALPDIDKIESVAIANKVLATIDSYGQRVADVMFNVRCPSTKPGVKAADDRAAARRSVYLGLASHNKVPLSMGRQGRWFIGLGSAPTKMTYDTKTGLVTRELRHPLNTLPGTPTNPDDPAVPDCIFTYTRTLAWLRKHYPDHCHHWKDKKGDTRLELIEYVDDNELTLLCMGAAPAFFDNRTQTPWRSDIFGEGSNRGVVVELEHARNLGGVCPAVYPQRTTLDKLAGQTDSMLGMHQTEGFLMALAVNSALRSVYKEQWLVTRAGGVANIVNMADGPKGELGIVEDAEFMSPNMDRSYQTDQTMALLERNQKVEGKLPAQFSGEAASGARTGRAQDGIIAAAVEPTLAEAHRVFDSAMETEFKISRALLLAHSPDRPRSVYVSWRNATGPLTFTPSSVLAESDAVEVTRAIAGADVAQTTLNLGQLHAVEAISLDTFREEHPMIRDAAVEKNRVNVEQMDRAFMGAQQQKLASGAVANMDYLYARSLVAQGMEPAEAFEKADERARERLATQGAPGAPDGPALPGSPEAQLGIEAGATGAAAPTPGATPNLRDLAYLVSNITGPQSTVERVGG